MLENTLGSPLDCKEIKPVNPKGHQPLIFTGRINAEEKLQYLGHLRLRTDALEKTLMRGKIEGRRRGRQRNEMVGWGHQLDGPEFEQTLEDGEGQGILVCLSPWYHKESDIMSSD